jgi:hypothetical protein
VNFKNRISHETIRKERKTDVVINEAHIAEPLKSFPLQLILGQTYYYATRSVSVKILAT